MYFGTAPSDETLAAMMRTNNPDGEDVGAFTGRCPNCGSKDLWDDETAWGCNTCHAIFFTG